MHKDAVHSSTVGMQFDSQSGILWHFEFFEKSLWSLAGYATASTTVKTAEAIDQTTSC